MGRRRSISEEGLVVSLQWQAPELDLDGPLSRALTAHLQTDAAFPVRSHAGRSVLGRDGGHSGAVFGREGLQEGHCHPPAQSVEVTDIGGQERVLHDATVLLLRAEDETGVAFDGPFRAVDGFAGPLRALALLLNYRCRHA
jgi:hypothetical protein